jgi:hypothetical protein
MLTRLTRPGVLLWVEGAALLAASVVIYWQRGLNGWLFALLLLAPDLAMLGYLAGKESGAAVYNLFHVTLWPLALAVYGWVDGSDTTLMLGLIWLAHIGMDRLAGYGLKYPADFKETHFNRL